MSIYIASYRYLDYCFSLTFDGDFLIQMDRINSLDKPFLPLPPDIKALLDDYFYHGRPLLYDRLKLYGTPFEIAVWKALQDIPYGTTTTYSVIASMIKRPKSYRAVANAIGKNPILLFIPCHRIIRKDMSIGGFSSGIDLKNFLLKHEQITYKMEDHK